MEKIKIDNILDKIGIPINIKGYRYIVQAVQILEKNKKNKLMNIYKEIAEKEEVRPQAVERAIRFAYERKKEELKETLGLNCTLNNSILIQTILREMERENARK